MGRFLRREPRITFLAQEVFLVREVSHRVLQHAIDGLADRLVRLAVLDRGMEIVDQGKELFM
ncbi:MAG TPA: hypothetical protein VHE79_04675, partial [Spirochaetia bacterium]